MKQLISGIKGSKPGSGPPKPDAKLPKEESHALDREYRIQRNETLRLKNHREQMLLAKARGELVERKLVEFQASYLLIAMRSRILRLPADCAPQLAGLTDVHEIRTVARRRRAGTARRDQRPSGQGDRSELD